MKKHILFAAGAMLAAVLMTGCGSPFYRRRKQERDRDNTATDRNSC